MRSRYRTVSPQSGSFDGSNDCNTVGFSWSLHGTSTHKGVHMCCALRTPQPCDSTNSVALVTQHSPPQQPCMTRARTAGWPQSALQSVTAASECPTRSQKSTVCTCTIAPHPASTTPPGRPVTRVDTISPVRSSKLKRQRHTKFDSGGSLSEPTLRRAAADASNKMRIIWFRGTTSVRQSCLHAKPSTRHSHTSTRPRVHHVPCQTPCR